VGKFIPVEPEKWAEMVKAMAENARLKAEVERLKMEQRLKAVPVEAKLLDRIAELKAEVERLTKAGDVLANNIVWVELYRPLVAKWNAAKKGGQP
jgi:uncharacterized small protein (DUF1192 family)